MDAGKLNLDDPPYSRLFIVCSKTITEEELRSAFEKYGTIEQIFLVKDTNTREPKGVAFIKFAKTSEAAQALEEMNGCCIGSHTKPLYIRIAESREPGAKREINEEETLLRLFCVVPKTTTDQMLRDHFKQFGDLDYVSVVKDRVTNDSKGVAYVKFDKFSAAAKAFEECDKLYKVSFAKPKSQKYQLVEPFEPVSSPSSIMGYGTAFSPFSTNSSSLISSEGFRALKIIAPPSVSQNHLWRLFDLVPGLNFLKLDTKTRPGHAVAMYNNHEAAAYALKKLHGFEYPPGQRLIVKPDIDRYGSLPLPHLRGNALGRDPYASPLSARLPLDLPAVAPHNPLLKTDLAVLAKTIAQATSILHSGRLAKGPYESSYSSMKLQGSPMDIEPSESIPAARLPMSMDLPSASGDPSNPDFAALKEAIAKATSIIQSLTQGTTREMYNISDCTVNLPSPQPLAPSDAETAERLFVVCNPQPLPTYVLKDVFGRFGNLIDVHVLSGKNYGYVKYATKESAEQAIETLHGQEICGIFLKVKTADPPSDTSRKRIRTTDD